MPVKIKELSGFGFVYQPKRFDAAFCAGRCPARYHPFNDHSLIQSLVHIKTKREAKRAMEAGDDVVPDKVKTPCCSPAQFENLDILHLDESNVRKLRVTNWKNIIVSECACA